VVRRRRLNWWGAIMTSLDDDARKSVQDALDALRQWRKEIDAVNERGLTRAMDRMAAAQQALGWPNRVTTDTGPSAVLPGKMHYFMVLDAVRDQLLKSSNEDMRVIDKVAEACFASLQTQTPISPLVSVSSQAVSDGMPPAEAPSKGKSLIFAGLLVAIGSIGYVIHSQAPEPIAPPVNSEKSVDDAKTSQKPAETTLPGEPTIPPSSLHKEAVPQEKAPETQASTTPETPSQTGERKLTVELGALSSRDQATRRLSELQRRAADVLAGHATVVAKAKRSKGTVWILEIRDFTEKSTAVDFCARLHSKGVKCDIRVSE
jgi:hypothetical protein